MNAARVVSQQALQAGGFPHFCCLRRNRTHLATFLSVVLRASSTWRCTGFSFPPVDPGLCTRPLVAVCWAGRVNTVAEPMQKHLPGDTG